MSNNNWMCAREDNDGSSDDRISTLGDLQLIGDHEIPSSHPLSLSLSLSLS